MVVFKKFWKNGEGKAVSAQGASGGILTWWDKNLFKFKSTIENRYWLFVELECLKNQEIIWIGNVYGPIIHGAKEQLWTQLELQTHGNMYILCIIAGEFNVTISLEEEKRRFQSERSLRGNIRRYNVYLETC